MSKERFKNLLLVFLIILNFVLGSEILVKKKLWPDGYNFFSSIGNFEISEFFTNIKDYFADVPENKVQVFMPERVIVNTGDQTTRKILDASDEGFNTVLDSMATVLKDTFSAEGKEISMVDRSEIYSALTTESVYLDYSARYSPYLYSMFLGIQEGMILEGIEGFSDVIVEYSPKICVYLADIDNDRYCKISINKSYSKVNEAVEECLKNKSTQTDSVINYSFDLKFDMPFGVQKTTINPFVQIYSTVGTYPVIRAENPVFDYEMNINEEMVEKILNVFDMSASTMRRYTEAGGAIVFVENNATLKIDRTGYLEYEATQEGIELSAVNNEYINVVNLSAIAEKINEATGNKNPVCLTKSGTDDNIICFDYLVLGLPVRIKNGTISSGIEAVVADGHLKKYKQYIRNYEPTNQIAMPAEFFVALDGVIEEYSHSMNEIYINEMYIGYSDNTIPGEKSADWIVDVDNVIAGE